MRRSKSSIEKVASPLPLNIISPCNVLPIISPVYKKSDRHLKFGPNSLSAIYVVMIFTTEAGLNSLSWLCEIIGLFSSVIFLTIKV